jgi:hypothetical protein
MQSGHSLQKVHPVPRFRRFCSLDLEDARRRLDARVSKLWQANRLTRVGSRSRARRLLEFLSRLPR